MSYTQNNTGSSNYHTQYNGGIGADKTLRIPITDVSNISGFTMEGLIKINATGGFMEYHDGNSWIRIVDLPYSDINYKPNNYIPDYSEITNTPNLSNYYLASNPNGYISNVPAQSWLSITGKPITLAGYGITDAYPLTGNPSGFLTSFTETDPTVPTYAKTLTGFSVIKSSTDSLYKSIGYTPTSGEITTALGFTPVSQAGARSAINLTTTGTSGAATYNSSTGTLNIPNYATSYTPSINNNVSRSFNSNFTISVSQMAEVRYTVTLSCSTPLLAGSESAQVFLEYSTNGGSTWITVADVLNTQTVALSVSVAITTPQNFVLSGMIPANATVRLRSVTTGTGSVTYVRGQEVY